jgi:hypothetical protein
MEQPETPSDTGKQWTQKKKKKLQVDMENRKRK